MKNGYWALELSAIKQCSIATDMLNLKAKAFQMKKVYLHSAGGLLHHPKILIHL